METVIELERIRMSQPAKADDGAGLHFSTTDNSRREARKAVLVPNPFERSAEIGAFQG